MKKKKKYVERGRWFRILPERAAYIPSLFLEIYATEFLIHSLASLLLLLRSLISLAFSSFANPCPLRSLLLPLMKLPRVFAGLALVLPALVEAQRFVGYYGKVAFLIRDIAHIAILPSSPACRNGLS